MGHGVMECTTEEVKALSETRKLWREIERESMGRALARDVPPAPAPDIPPPAW